MFRIADEKVYLFVFHKRPTENHHWFLDKGMMSELVNDENIYNIQAINQWNSSFLENCAVFIS